MSYYPSLERPRRIGKKDIKDFVMSDYLPIDKEKMKQYIQHIVSDWDTSQSNVRNALSDVAAEAECEGMTVNDYCDAHGSQAETLERARLWLLYKMIMGKSAQEFNRWGNDAVIDKIMTDLSDEAAEAGFDVDSYIVDLANRFATAMRNVLALGGKAELVDDFRTLNETVKSKKTKTLAWILWALNDDNQRNKLMSVLGGKKSDSYILFILFD